MTLDLKTSIESRSFSLVVRKPGFRPGPTQTGLYSHRRWLEACHFGFRKYRDCTICVAKTKALISCAVTVQLICAFVFAYAKSCTICVAKTKALISCAVTVQSICAFVFAYAKSGFPMTRLNFEIIKDSKNIFKCLLSY